MHTVVQMFWSLLVRLGLTVNMMDSTELAGIQLKWTVATTI